MKVNYRCEFVLDVNGDRIYGTAKSKKGLDAFIYGFWLDREYGFTTGADSRYWVPPHAISVIVREPLD